MRTSRRGEVFSGTSDTSYEEPDLYEALGKYYDIWYEDQTDEVQFYRQLAEKTGGPILECMCGTGRSLIPLAEDGYEIWGFDRSHSMLDRLTAKMEQMDEEVQERVQVHHADMRTFQCPRRYNLIIVPFNSFLHLLEREGQESALRNVVEHLEEGGRFVMSVFNPRLDRPEELVRHRGTRTAVNGEIISKFEAQTFDQPLHRTTVHYFIDVSRQDKEMRRVTACFTIRYMSYQEVVELMEDCGLEVTETYGDWNFGHFTKNSDLMVFEVKRSP
ncbi:MAG: class I SAM-dependent methyltransferase [Methanomassiliicoccales archaeon]|nr:class I SAM-dependent methyltransferase [Methanomassiliicoccales archaeon]